MINIYDFVNENQKSRRFKVDELLFLDYDCPVDDDRMETWTHINFFFFMLKGHLKWKTLEGEYNIHSGDAVFIKKGAHIVLKELNHHFCALLFFVPDEFLKKVIQSHLPELGIIIETGSENSVIPLEVDETLSQYFTTVLHYLSQNKPPSKSLLKIKFEELIIYLITGNKNPMLTRYFREICQSRKRSVKSIMENNYFFNLKLNEYAKLCGRSLATGKHGLIAETQDQGQATGFDVPDAITNPGNHSAEGRNYTDWRLPTLYELGLLYQQRETVGGFINNGYWSSTDSSYEGTWIKSFPSGGEITIGKTYTFSVRAVRSF